MSIIQFSPLQSRPSSSFWSSLASLKLDKLKLDDSQVDITGYFERAKVVQDKAVAGQDGVGDVFVGGSLSVDADAFDESGGSRTATLGMVPVSGLFKNFNTIEEFKSPDIKKELFTVLVDRILTSFTTPQPEFNPFLLLSYSDLKRYKFHYWFAFPAIVQKPAWEYSSPAEGVQGGMSVWRGDARVAVEAKEDAGITGEAWLVRGTTGNDQVGEVKDWSKFFEGVPEDERTLYLHDPSSLPDNPSWPLRNILYYLSLVHRVHQLRVVLIRDGPSASRVFTATVSELPGRERPAAVGWEKNGGVLKSRMADLGATMDPTRLADQAVDLNLKLMRWRILPSLDLDKIAGTKCLLLGAGTLGCYVARCLMGWGVRNITFVDSSRVSYSNPVRQPLFEFEDCLGGGKPKAQCAADRLKRIFPGVNATGVELSIPMPGHPISPTDHTTTSDSVSTLESLIRSHDAVFLLMDSRESRWLPTVIGAAEGKIVMNAALGFDSWLVMRHGAGPAEEAAAGGGKRLGCYYCNDIVAPADSLTDRTLDQMCTVTRPGIAPIAAASAVELLISLVQHPAGVNAPAETADSGSHQGTNGSALGLVPHQLRGFLGQWRTMLIEGMAYDKCTGCSKTVVDAYKTGGFPFLLRAFNEADFLEKLTGLDKLHEEGEAALEAVDWDESSQEGSF